jgi:hypothetical protein
MRTEIGVVMFVKLFEVIRDAWDIARDFIGFNVFEEDGER